MESSKLKTITDNTVVKLIKNDIILPSTYFETFKQSSEELNIDISSEEIQNEISKTIQDDMNKLHLLMNQTMDNMEKFSQETSKAQEAINNNDTQTLASISQEINNLQKEMFELMDQVYIDSLTNNKNRKWLYHKYLQNEDLLLNSGIFIYINLNDIKYINDEYGELIGNNLIRYVSNTLNKKLAEEQLSYKMVRYCNDKFMLFIQSTKIEEITSIINAIRTKIASTTLKSNSGILLKTKFSFGIVEFAKNDKFHEILDQANSLEEEDRNSLDN